MYQKIVLSRGMGEKEDCGRERHIDSNLNFQKSGRNAFFMLQTVSKRLAKIEREGQ